MQPHRFLSRMLAAGCTVFLASCTGDQHREPAAEGKLQSTSHVADSPRSVDIRKIRVISQQLVRDMRIPGELIAFREVAIYPKVQGFVRSIEVDRGSAVRRGQILVKIVAPEIDAQRGEAAAKSESARSAVTEAESKIQSLMAQRSEAESRLASDEALYRRIKNAAKTEGAVAPYDIEQAEQKVAAAKARVQSTIQVVEAARSQLNSEKGKLKGTIQALNSAAQMENYLTVRAPFDGVITERNVHEGSLVNSSATNGPMLKIEQKSTLRLLVPIPESAVAGVRIGSTMQFTVPAFSSKVFTGTIQRLSHSLDRKTRSMVVEADVSNTNGELEPGMYPDVTWRMVAPYPTRFVPSQALTTGDSKPTVFRIKNGIAEPIQVTCKQSMDDLIEIVGDVNKDDEVALTGLHELKKGVPVNAQLTSLAELRSISAKHEKGHH